MKENLILNIILCFKGRSSLRSHPLARNRTKQILRCNNQANLLQLPAAKTSESIEPNDNNLQLNAIAYTFSKIDSNLNFNRLFGFPSEANEETEKKNTSFLCCGRFHSIAVAFRNTKTRREDETKGPNRQRSKTSLENIKALLASLSFHWSRAPTEWSAIFAFGVSSN